MYFCIVLVAHRSCACVPASGSFYIYLYTYIIYIYIYTLHLKFHKIIKFRCWRICVRT